MPVLTAADRDVIAKARELAAITTIAVLRKRYGTDPAASNDDVFADYWGESAYLLGVLADRLERLAGA